MWENGLEVFGDFKLDSFVSSSSPDFSFLRKHVAGPRGIFSANRRHQRLAALWALTSRLRACVRDHHNALSIRSRDNLFLPRARHSRASVKLCSFHLEEERAAPVASTAAALISVLPTPWADHSGCSWCILRSRSPSAQTACAAERLRRGPATARLGVVLAMKTDQVSGYDFAG